jgi:hypothetical protein
MTAMDDLIRKIERGALILMIAVAAYYIHRFDKERALKEAAQLASKGLPPDVLAQYTFQNNKLIELVKNAQGKTEVKTVYVPDEGKITVVTKERDEAIKKYQDLLEQLKNAKTPEQTKKIEGELKAVSDGLNKAPDITATTWGLTSRFGYGMVISPGHSLTFTSTDGNHFKLPVSPELDWKWGYYNRYSGLLQANIFYVGPGVTRHIDDITPRWMHVNNLEWGLSGGLQWTGGYAIGTNLRSNW